MPEATPAVIAQPPPPVRSVEKPKPAPKDKAEKVGFGTVVGKIANGADAIVYVETVNAPVKGATASMKQEGKAFLPSTLVVTKGTKVDFPNRDAIFHNVFSVTPDNSFDLGSYRQGESKSVVMTKPGVVTVYCNMHPQMVGHILVVPNSNYVRAGADGFFRLTNVPAGQHRIVAWVPNSKAVTVSANVVENEVATVEMELKRGKAAPHTKKDGLPYGSYDK
jgi:plastocyanin